MGVFIIMRIPRHHISQIAEFGQFPHFMYKNRRFESILHEVTAKMQKAFPEKSRILCPNLLFLFKHSREKSFSTSDFMKWIAKTAGQWRKSC